MPKGGFKRVRAPSREQAWLAEQAQLPVEASNSMKAREGELAEGSTGGDFTANLPRLIVDQPQAERPDYRAYDDKKQWYGEKADRGLAESAARQKELRNTLARIDLKAQALDPGGISNANFGLAGPSAMVIEQANRAKYDKMLSDSRRAALAAHAAKYGLPMTDQLGAGMPGFQRVGRAW